MGYHNIPVWLNALKCHYSYWNIPALVAEHKQNLIQRNAYTNIRSYYDYDLTVKRKYIVYAMFPSTPVAYHERDTNALDTTNFVKFFEPYLNGDFSATY